MALSYIGNGTTNSTNGASPGAMTFHASTTDGDLVICECYSREVTDGSFSVTAGWTEIFSVHRDSGGCMGAWWKIFVSGDTLSITNVNHTSGSTGDTTGAQTHTWRGADTTTPIGTVGTISTNAAQLNIGPISGISIDAGNAVVVMGGKLDDWTSVADLSGDGLTWTLIGGVNSSSGADAAFRSHNAIDGGSGTTVTSKTYTVTGGTNVAGKGVMFEVNAAAAAVTQAIIIL